jgi:hypothetical protein
MSNLIAEILLRLVKPIIAGVLGLLLYFAATISGVPGSFELLLMCWVSAAAFILLIQESPL